MRRAVPRCRSFRPTATGGDDLPAHSIARQRCGFIVNMGVDVYAILKTMEVKETLVDPAQADLGRHHDLRSLEEGGRRHVASHASARR